MKHLRLFALATALAALLCACGSSQETPSESGQKLQFSVVEAEEPGFTLVSREDLGGKEDVELSYGDLSEVNVTLDGETISLAEAIREDALTVPELFAYARMDAQNGFCWESYTSENGLSHFRYTYPECEMWITYDVYETPNGGQNLINEICIYSITDSARSVSFFYVDEESEWGYFLDREDWGLTLEASDVTPTGMTVSYTHNAAQEIGTLTLDSYSLYARKDDGTAEYLGKGELDTVSIPEDGSGQITLDWSGVFGPLEPGAYYVKLSVVDNYDESQVHPLMANFYDRQSYHIAFTIE